MGKPRPVKVRVLKRVHEGQVTEPYRIMEEIIEEHRPDLQGARIVICGNTSWNPDTDGLVKHGTMQKASDKDRALHGWDAVLTINETIWQSKYYTQRHKRRLMHHELEHLQRDLDRDGQQKKDEQGRLCWRKRDHDFEDFHSTVELFGLPTPELDDIVEKAYEEKNRPLLKDEDKKGDEEEAEGGSADELVTDEEVELDDDDGEQVDERTPGKAAAVAGAFLLGLTLLLGGCDQPADEELAEGCIKSIEKIAELTDVMQDTDQGLIDRTDQLDENQKALLARLERLERRHDELERAVHELLDTVSLLLRRREKPAAAGGPIADLLDFRGAAGEVLQEQRVRLP